MTENQIATIIVDSAYRIHTRFGPGLLESVYKVLLAYELRQRGLYVQTEWPIPLVYEDIHMKVGFRADLIVERRVIVEVKSLEAIHQVHLKQLLTYLRIPDLRLGLLINFGAAFIKDGIKRVVNRLEE